MEEYKKLLEKGKFRYLWGSQILSQLTVNIINFLILTRLFTITQSAIATSMLWIAYALPAIIVGPFGAASVDMVSKRKILIISNILQSLTVFLYALLGQGKLFLPYGMAIVYSFINQFNDPAEAAAVPSLVKKGQLTYANGLFFITTQGSLILGFGIAGLLNTLMGYQNTLFLCSSFLIASAVSVSFIPEIKSHDFVPKNLESAIVKFFSRITEGYQFIKNNRWILTPFLILIGLQIILSIVIINVPVIASEILKINVNSAGIFVVIPAGIGAILGAIATNKLVKQGWRKKTAIEFFLKVEIIAFAFFSLIVGFIPFTFLRVLISALTVVAVGFGFVGLLIPTQTFLQENTPGGLRGRVFGNFSFIVTIAAIFPIIFSGAITEIFGIRLLIFFLACISFITLLFSKNFGQRYLENGVKT